MHIGVDEFVYNYVDAIITLNSYLRRTPPRSEALRHSGGDSLLWTSATVTLYFDVELSSESLPGTEQKTSLGAADNTRPSLPAFWSLGRIPLRKAVSSSIWKMKLKVLFSTTAYIFVRVPKTKETLVRCSVFQLFRRIGFHSDPKK